MLKTLERLLEVAKKLQQEDEYRASTRDSEFYRGAANAGGKYIQELEIAIMRTVTIDSAVISPMPIDFGDPMPRVTAIMGDGRMEYLFWYYPNELSFTEEEFVGLTLEEGKNLKFEKDKKYLKSPSYEVQR